MSKNNLHILMFPWFAVGHMTPYLHLANELAQRGQNVTVLLPKKAVVQLTHLNFYPTQITLHPLSVPAVPGLPPGTEAASDIPFHLHGHLATAMDLTRSQVADLIHGLKPDLVFYDFAYWISEVTAPLGIKMVNYNVVCAACITMRMVLGCKLGWPMVDEHFLPPSYPSRNVVLRGHERETLKVLHNEFGSGISFYDHLSTVFKSSDVIAIRTCRELEGIFCDYLSSQFEKQVLLTGPILPKPNESPMALEARWAEWLDGFEPGSVVFCAFGSQFILEKDQFQELVQGFEMTNLPFFVAVKPPLGCSTIEEALPKGFVERVKGRGVVHGGWVQQPLILNRPSVGCFVNHCGFGSMWESLMAESQIVLVPQLVDQILNTRLLAAAELKVAVEVEREENRWVRKESLCKAIKTVMDKDGEVALELKKSHAKWRKILVEKSFMSNYMDKFVKDIQVLVDKN